MPDLVVGQGNQHTSLFDCTIRSPNCTSRVNGVGSTRHWLWGSSASPSFASATRFRSAAAARGVRMGLVSSASRGIVDHCPVGAPEFRLHRRRRARLGYEKSREPNLRRARVPTRRRWAAQAAPKPGYAIGAGARDPPVNLSYRPREAQLRLGFSFRATSSAQQCDPQRQHFRKLRYDKPKLIEQRGFARLSGF